jgi:hypothetical protein
MRVYSSTLEPRVVKRCRVLSSVYTVPSVPGDRVDFHPAQRRYNPKLRRRIIEELEA